MADADEVFLTSAALGVALVTTFDYHSYTIPFGSPALRLREAYRQLTLDPEAFAPTSEQSRVPE
jgi:branched-subunit amino acid aminotransferase/4-amino-4-deoxychorismate lyase